MANQMEPFPGPATTRHNFEDVVNQSIVGIVLELARIRPGATGVATLVWRNGAISQASERGDLPLPSMFRLRKPVQEDHEFTATWPTGQRIELLP